MYIKTTNDALRRLFNVDVIPPEDDRECEVEDYRLEFSENNLAQCKQEVGEAYVEHYEDLTVHDPEE